MRKMCRNMAGFLLLAVLICGLFPVTAEAAAPESSFILVAEAGGKLVIAPEYVTYETGLNIGQALAASEHEFDGLADGQVYAIDGVVGSYTRSDQTGSYDLAKPASEVTHYRFSENIGSSQLSKSLMALMTVMADYLLEEPDVQAAAKSAYDMACKRFVGATDQEAAAYAKDLSDAVADYKAAIAGSTHTVVFSGFTNANYPGIVITAKNTYGKVWADDGDGKMSLPDGSYTFHIEHNGLHVEGGVTVAGSDQTIQASFPTETWMNMEAFALSANSNPASGAVQDADFESGRFEGGVWTERTYAIVVKDTFTGTVYTYAEYNKDCFAENVVPTLTAVYENTAGEQVERRLAFESKVIGPAKVLSRGGTGNQVIYRISTTDTNGYVLSQDYTVHFSRIPTLTGITVKDQKDRAQAATTRFSDDVTEYTYKVLNEVTSLTLKPIGLDGDYTITVNGQDASNGVIVPIDEETVDITVVVSCGEYENTYTLHIQKGAGRNISFKTNADSFRVVNSEGMILPFEKEQQGPSESQWKYVLVPGETYYYEATKNTYYHVGDTFTLDANNTVIVSVPTDDWLTELALGNDTQNRKKGNIKLDSDFETGTHTYSAVLSDAFQMVCLWAKCENGAKIEVLYDQLSASELYHNVSKTVPVVSGNMAGTQLDRVLVAENPYSNTITVRLSKQGEGDEQGVTYYQDYRIELERELSLKDLSVFFGQDTVVLYQPDSTIGYKPAEHQYTITVPMAADSLTLRAQTYANGSNNLCYGEDDNGYVVLVNGVETVGSTVVPLSGTPETETIEIAVSSSKTDTKATVYTIAVQKAAPTVVELNLTPADALLCVHERTSGNRVWPESGELLLSEGFTYTYTLTRNGYVGQRGTLEVTRDEEKNLIINHNGTILDASSGTVALTLSLEQAPINPDINADILSKWSDFRGNAENNGITDAVVPITAETGSLYWANKLGSGIDADAVGCPILVDDALITYSGDTLYRIDTVSGAILATGKMDHKSSFSITPPTYYEGMLFLALSDGTIQAFNADTLESLWIYKDPLGGQPNSPIAVCNGYLYTGFWYSETGDANFVCLSVTDEDPTQPKEEKPVTWYHTKQGGYYWAGAYVTEDWLLVGTDDGFGGYTHQTSQLLLLDSKTGKLLDSWDNLNSDIRSTVVYDAATNACYFTAKGGTFYSVQVENGKLTNKWSVALDNGSETTPMSTSTPVVYNGRAYIGVSGIGQFSAYSGHNITVIDLSKKAIAYRMETQGYPQTSGLLTTAYEEANGYVYVYFFDNYTPGKLRVLRDKAGQTAPDYVTVESGAATPYALFTPVGNQAQYAICSPIVDEYGTIYFKNDSAHLMAFGSTITKLEVTKMPDKTEYTPEEAFDPTGMVVTATYANGKTRNVTAYVTASDIAEGDSTVTLTFPYVMYHNQENGTAMDAGVVTPMPHVEVEITVITEELEPAAKMEELTIGQDQVIVQCDGGILREWTVYAGVYTQSGKLVRIVSVSGTGRKTVKLSLPDLDEAYEVRAFILNADSAPVMACLSSLDQQGEEGT